MLHERLAPQQVAFSTIPRIQDFPLLPQPLAWYMGLRARRLNRVTHQTLPALPSPPFAGSPDSRCTWNAVDLDLPLTANFLAHDGFHPNEAACGLWCEQVLAAVQMGPDNPRSRP